jgi:hypothetical protein
MGGVLLTKGGVLISAPVIYPRGEILINRVEWKFHSWMDGLGYYSG